MLVGTDPFLNSQRDKIIALAARNAIPAIYEQREHALAGGLISYGTNLSEGYRRRLCREDSQGRETRGLAGSPGHQI